MTLARIFVAVVYLILGLSFLASTGLLIQEFQGLDWRSMVIAHSHLFFFFPIFGILALAAFYRALGGLHRPLLAPSALRQAALPGRARRAGRGLLGRRQIARQAAARHLGGLAACADGRQGRSRGLRRRQQRRRAGARRSSPRCRGCARRGRPGSACRSSRAPATLDKLLELPEEMEKKRHCFPADARSRRRTAARCRSASPARSRGCRPIRPGARSQPSTTRCSCRSRSSSSCS